MTRTIISSTISKIERTRLALALGLLALLFSLAVSPVFAQQIHELSFNGSSWMDANLNGTMPYAFTGIAAFPTTPNDQRHVYFADNDLAVHQLFYNGTSWSDENLTALSGSEVIANPETPISGFSVGNYQYVYYTALSAHVHQLLYNNSNWTDTDLSLQTGGPLSVGSLVAFTTTPALHVYYADLNGGGDLHQLFSTDGTNWQDQDLTLITGGAASASPWITGFNVGNYQYVYFISSNGHVHQYFYNNAGWSDKDLTALTKSAAVPVAGGVQALVIPGTTKLRVYVETTKGHIVQLASTNNVKWASTDLTNKAKAPVAAATDQFYVGTSAPNNQIHISYVGAAGSAHPDVLQLFQPTSTTWSYEDLTTLGNGARPVIEYGDIVGFSLQNNQYLYYVGE